MKIDNVTFPPQKISMKAKDETWGKTCVNAIIGRSGGGTLSGLSRHERMGICYGLYDSEFNKDDFKYITDPYSVGDVFPANMQNYNIIRPKVDLLVGEESKRPDNFRIIQTNEEAIGMAQERSKEMLLQYMLDSIRGQVQEGQTPEFIQKYMRYSYKTTAEEVAENVLNYLKQRLNLKDEFLKGFKDAMAASEEIYYTSIVNGEPYAERVNPIECEFDRDSGTEYVDEKEWFRRTWYMTATAIYDRFHDIMEEKDLDKLLEKYTSSDRSIGPESPFKNVIYSENITSKFTDRFRTDDRPYDSIEVSHCVWRSFKKVGFLRDPEGNMIDLVDESYKVLPGEEIEWDWITEIWEGYKIGEDLYIGVRPLPYQHQSLENLNDARLPYTGIVYNTKSLIEIMKPLQYMYMVIWYRLELAMSRDKGKILNMDLTQIPKKYGFGIEKWLHYLTSIGVNFINPYEEGWDVPGREGGKPSQFNQIAVQDLGMSDVISGYIELMMKIEDMVGEISGVSKARQGQIHQSELVGNVQREIIQSSHITEPLFWKHNQGKRRVYSNLINIAKYAYSESGRSKLQYILSDGARAFLDIQEDFLYADLDIFVTDSTEESQNIEALKSLLQAAMQNGATLLDAAHILTNKNMSMIKDRLKEIDDRRAQQEQQLQQQEAQMQQMQVQAQQEIAAEQNRIKEEDSIRRAETQIQVALISAGAKSSEGEEADVDDNGMMDILEQQKLDLQQKKIDNDNRIKERDARLKERAQSEAERKNRTAEKQKEQELVIKRIAARKKPASTSKK